MHLFSLFTFKNHLIQCKICEIKDLYYQWLNQDNQSILFLKEEKPFQSDKCLISDCFHVWGDRIF